MDEEEFLREKEKLSDVSQKLTKEEEVLEDTLQRVDNNYEKDSYVRAHLVYLKQKKIKDIKKIKDRPYFARIDFKEEGEEKEVLYIGKISIIDSETNEPIIIDWRAPISNLYYDGRIGRSSYASPEGIIEGDILLKRQYLIENNELKKYINIDLKVNDELLQVALEEKADERLKNIVSTIQSEQNEVIRANMNNVLVVQGVAGSGKTTIALHRIAYLIYNTQKEFDPDNFMIIAPNRFFLNYISNVLPDLGVENVKQYTFEDFAFEVIGKKLKISDKNEKLVTIVNKEYDMINKGNEDIMIKESKYKSSIGYKDVVDNYLKVIESNFIPHNDFMIENIKIMSYEAINDLFMNTYKSLNFLSRINEVKKHIFSKIKNNKDTILKVLEEKRSRQINEVMLNPNLSDEEKRSERIRIFEENEELINMIYKDSIKVVDKYFSEISKLDALGYYKDFIENYIYKEISDEELSDYLISNTLQNINKKEISFEDLAPIIYIHNKIFGTKSKKELRHIIVDEAQDYGEFQFYVLRNVLKSNSMTILGDIAQGVHFYRGIENWKRFIDVEFPDADTKFLTLSKTYRTTKEVMNIANNVISKLPDYEKQYLTYGEPVIDRKDSVYIKQIENDKERFDLIEQKIVDYKNKQYKSIAIIGKDIHESKLIYKELISRGIDCNLIQSKDSEYYGGISIVPSYLAKGLEFDCVILFDVSNVKYKENSLDIKLLYVAITRAMSKLDIFYKENISNLLLENANY